MAPRKNIPLRLDPAIYDAIAHVAADELRSVNSQIELMLREQLRTMGRLPSRAGELPRRGRPRKNQPATDNPDLPQNA